jgi:murein L,D-transpeptidase YcbB/YkuD
MGVLSTVRALTAPVLLAAFVATLFPAGAQGPPEDELDEVLRRTLEAGGARGEIEIGSDLAFASEALPRFYAERGFEPAWTAPDGPLPEARTLVRLLQEAELDGLRGSDYHLARITALLGGRRGPVTEELDHLELALSDAALVYAAHLAAGKTDPAALHPQWRATRNDLDAARFLADALDGGDLRAAYEGLRPPYPDYRRLRQGLADLRRIAAAGGWGAVPPGEALRPGEASERVPALRARLAASGDLPPTRVPPADPVYDPDLEAAVLFFQSRHGLTADGVVGERTLAALNVPVALRIDQVRVNLERWRWLPADLGERHLRVNIAGFGLQAFEAGRVELESRVIVGKAYTRTPVFSDEVTYLVVNPYWYVPASIAGHEILPRVQADRSYLAREGLQVLDGTGPSARALDPAAIDWGALSAGRLPYVFRQRPGPGNSLGRIKFMFPNPYNVYLHDTPAKALFERDVRTFSHGCIRMERPLDLAAWLLRDDPRWSRERLEALIASGAQQTVRLPEPVPIHVQYWTAWADGQGAIHLRDDVYDRDGAVLRALDEAPPG